ncbi:molybdate ABC transporter substrate-binding protein [Flammeovirga sp. SubArs3]|uniref:molybdate ABC transporter substrate-binding protein n=1 Tax=Flammeovirga sp. SubArs3 TaxID=2995316 RepID=UPI00248B73C0|nr:molybdate ABC transporter substrate-binding protein [Flammeovirga sp. SubArs3]
MRNILSGLVLFLVISLQGCDTSKRSTLKIATSANMNFVIRELVQEFNKETSIECDIILSSSGKLYHQIKEGAPYDVFVSADMKYPQQLFEEGKTLKSPDIYTKGTLVAWTIKPIELRNMDDIFSASIHKIGIANPKTAPYGVAAISAIHEVFGTNLDEKLVYGESISQITRYVHSGSVDVAFTSLFIANSPSLKNVGHWVKVPNELYPKINQGAVVIKGNDEENAQLFLNWLMSKKGQDIIASFSN